MPEGETVALVMETVGIPPVVSAILLLTEPVVGSGLAARKSFQIVSVPVSSGCTAQTNVVGCPRIGDTGNGIKSGVDLPGSTFRFEQPGTGQCGTLSWLFQNTESLCAALTSANCPLPPPFS